MSVKQKARSKKALEVAKLEDLDERALQRLYETDVTSPRQCWEWPMEARASIANPAAAVR